jgi:hypothetical protein
LDTICLNPDNRPIIDILQKGLPNIQISYLLGNHDMPMSYEKIFKTQEFMKDNFPNIKCLFNKDDELGIYEGDYKSKLLLAEHGNRYGLFNAVDRKTNPDSFLPIGYFISRFIGTKELKTGKGENIWNIAGNFIDENILDPITNFFQGLFKGGTAGAKFSPPNFVEGLFNAVAADARFDPTKMIDLNEVPGFEKPMGLDSIGKMFSNFLNDRPRKDILFAVCSDTGNLWPAASEQMKERKKTIVIFGHSHKPEMKYPQKDLSGEKRVSEIPSEWIYANCGSWVDKDPGWLKNFGGFDQVCSYVEVETEEIKEEKINRIHVRLKKVKNLEGILKNMEKSLEFETINEGFVKDYI